MVPHRSQHASLRSWQSDLVVDNQPGNDLPLMSRHHVGLLASRLEFFIDNDLFHYSDQLIWLTLPRKRKIVGVAGVAQPATSMVVAIVAASALAVADLDIFFLPCFLVVTPIVRSGREQLIRFARLPLVAVSYTITGAKTKWEISERKRCQVHYFSVAVSLAYFRIDGPSAMAFDSSRV